MEDIDIQDPFRLRRFVRAQEVVYEIALEELRQGRKRSHWMWYILPQLRGLGFSYNARYYGLSGLEEARAYLADPLLGARLREVAETLAALPGNDPVEILGDIDAAKLRSSMTLFDLAAPGDIFDRVLAKYFAGERCRRTPRMLRPRP